MEPENVLEGYLGDKDALESIVELVESVVPKGKTEKVVIKRAKPKVYGYRERFKTGTLKASDVTAFPRQRRVAKQFDPGSLDPGIARGAGYNPWFGEGTEVDY